MYQVVISYCYCEHERVIVSVTRGDFFVAFIFMSDYLQPDPLGFESILSYSFLLHIMFSRLCSDVLPSCPQVTQALTTLRSQLVQNSLGKTDFFVCIVEAS